MTSSDNPFFLKPCPFCGNEVFKVSACRLGGVWPDSIQCLSCDAKVEYDHHNCDDTTTGQILNELIVKWNRRVRE